MQISSKFDNSEIKKHLFPKRDGFFTADNGSNEISFRVDEKCTVRCRFYPSLSDAPTILFFPSTSEPLQDLDEMALSYNKNNINVLIVSYRNDTEDLQAQSLTTFFDDGDKIFHQSLQWLSDNGYTGPIFPMGQALGTSLVIDLVSKNDEAVKGMVLESSIYEIVPFLKASDITIDENGLSEDCLLDNVAKIEKIKLPTLIFHGARDPITSIAEAEKLQASSGARMKQFFIIPGAGQFGLSVTGGQLYFETIRKFFDTVCGVNTWRQKRKKYRNN